MTQATGPKPLRVLVGMPLAGLDGGAERLLAAFLPHAPAAGLDIHLVCFEDGPLLQIARDAGLRATAVPVERHNHPAEWVPAVRRVRALIREEDPDLVLSWLARAHFWLAPAALISGRRRRLLWWQRHIARGERLEKVVGLLPARKIVATSAAAAAAQEARWPHRSCVVVNPGIDPLESPGPDALAALRDELGIARDAALVGIVGRLVRWKGQHHFVEAIAELRAAGREVTGLVVGGENYGLDAGYFDELKQLARDRGVEDSVVFTGQVADPHPYVAAMDVLVSASDGEPFGVTLLEAMTLRTPIVAVARGGPLEIVEDGRSGVLVDDDTGASLAGGIERVLADPDFARALVDGAAARFAERFTAERYAIETERVLRSLAPPRNGSAV